MWLAYINPSSETWEVRYQGAQPQHIVLARALYRELRVLLLDEATSRLDEDNEQAINTVSRAGSTLSCESDHAIRRCYPPRLRRLQPTLLRFSGRSAAFPPRFDSKRPDILSPEQDQTGWVPR